MSDKLEQKDTTIRIFTIGETTFDILFHQNHPIGSASGGSAYNSAISLGRCRLPVCLISTFGNDRVGDFSLKFLQKNGVHCGLIKRFKGRSRLALAFIDPNSNATYSFYPASQDQVPDYPIPRQNDIILLGSSFALRDNGRENLLHYLHEAQRVGAIIIYDPNAREPMIDKPELLEKINQNIELATIVKGSDEDFHHIFGEDNPQNMYTRMATSENKYLIYTKGEKGAELLGQTIHLSVAANKTKIVSTVGAGDNFSAGIIYELYNQLENNKTLHDLKPAEWEKVMQSGTLFASAVCGSAKNYLPKEIAKNLRESIIL